MTQKQIQAIKNLMNTNGNVSKAMRLAGYAKATINQPQVLTRSKAFKELFKSRLTNDKLLKVHEEGLSATKLHGTDNDFVEIPDHDARYKFLALGYKVMGIDNNSDVSNTQINIMLGDDGYIPPNNIQGLKPSLEVMKKAWTYRDRKPRKLNNP